MLVNSLHIRSPYLWVILMAPVFIGILILVHGFTIYTPFYTFFCLYLLLLSAIDCDRLLLPDVLTLPGAALALLSAPYVGLSLTESLAGAFIGSAGFWIIATSFPKALGLGDAKFMLLLGALCGVKGLPVIVFVASVAGLATALTMRRACIPFGPFLSLGAYLHMVGVRA